MRRLLVLLLPLLLVAAPAPGQVVFDGSMGPAGPAPTRVSPGFATDYLVRYDEALADPAARHGIRRGPNLFQSLDQLDLALDERVSFQALDAGGQPIQDLDRVIARITSGSRSLIEGVLRSEIPGADLFLLNPAGIDFLGEGGTRRQLDLQGGFVASTADSLHFEDGAVFQVDALEGFELSAAPVESFGFVGGSRETIRFDEAGILEVPAGEDFTVVAGDVVVTGFASFDPAVPSKVSSIKAPGGTVQLAAVGETAAQVPLDVAQWAVRDAPANTLGDVVVEAFSDLRTNEAPDDQGRVVMRGGRLVVEDSRVQAGGNGPGTLALDLEAADEIVARQDARLQVFGTRAGGLGGGRLAARRIEVSGLGDRRTFVGPRPVGTTAEPFVVEADQVLVTGSASLVTEVSGLRGVGGPGAELRVVADELRVAEGAELGTRALAAAGPGGRVVIDAGRLVIDGGRVVSDNFLLAPDGSRVFGGGQAGDLEVVADELVMADDGRIEAFAGPAGDGGDIEVVARRIGMSGSAEINASTINDRDAGDVSVTATESLEILGDVPFSPTGIFARSGELGPGGLLVGSGDAGDLAVRSPVIELRGEAVLSTRSRGEGNPGSVEIVAGDLTLIGDEVGAAEISARAQDGDAGGSVRIAAERVLIQGGAAIAASTAGRSPGGRVDVDAATLEIRGVRPTAAADSSAILSDTTSGAADAGHAGEIDVDLLESLLVTEGGEIRAVTRGAGDAGSIDVVAGEWVEVSAGADITAAALAGSTGEAGNVSLQAPEIRIEGGSVTTEARNGTAVGDEVGGNIGLTSGSRTLITGGSLVSARSVGTQDAGRIAIDAGRKLLVVDSEITTEATEETANAAGGQIEITATKEVELLRSTVTTSVRAFEGNEDGGDITIDPRFVIVNRSDILAQAIFGNGGNIEIVAGNYLQSAESTVSASSELGIDGTVNVDAPDTELKGELARLPARFLDATELLREHCAARVAGRGSFVVAGSEASAAAPDRPLSAPMPLPGDDPRGAAGAAPTSSAPRAELRLAEVDCAALARDREGLR